MKKECGTCTKCCDGTLTGIIRNIPMYPGKPCFLLKENGCSDYKNRPYQCVGYKCLWLKDPEVPDFMKPENAKAIVDIETINGIKYLRLTKSEEQYSYEILEYALKYAEKNDLPFMWTDGENKINFVGDYKTYHLIISHNQDNYNDFLNKQNI